MSWALVMVGALLALASAGGADAGIAVVVGWGVVAAPRLRAPEIGLGWWVAAGVVIGATAVGFGRAEEGLGAVLALLLGAARLGPAGWRTEGATLLATSLLVVAGAVRAEGPLLALGIVLWALGLAALSGALRGWRALAGLAAVGLIYLLLPRPLPSGQGAGRVGLGGSVDLARFDALHDDPRWLADATGPVRWLRAEGFGSFDGRRWTAGVPASAVEVAGGQRVTVRHAAVGGPVLVPGPVARWEREPTGLDRSGDGHTAPGEVSWAGDAVVGVSPAAPPDDVQRAAWTALPVSHEALIRRLAAEVGGGSEAERVERVVSWLRSGFTYARRAGGGEDPLSTFLVGGRVGHCEHFATATALLLRAQGVPARLVAGVAGGDVTAEGVSFRAADAHAWVEAWVDGAWVVVDATPAGDVVGDEVVPATPPGRVASSPPVARAPGDVLRAAWAALSGWDAARQRGWLRGAAPWWVMGLAAAGAWWVRQRRAVGVRAQGATAVRPGVAGAWDRAVGGLQALGAVAPAGSPPLAAASELCRQVGIDEADLIALAWLHYEGVHGGVPEDDGRRARAEQLAAAVLTSARARKGGGR